MNWIKGCPTFWDGNNGNIESVEMLPKKIEDFRCWADLFPQVLVGVDPLKVIIAVELI